MEYKIEPRLCTNCGECANFCPADAIKQNAVGQYYIDMKDCTSCGHCVEYCPEHAIIEV